MNTYKRTAFWKGPFFSQISWQKYKRYFSVCIIFFGLAVGCAPASDDQPSTLDTGPAQIIQDGIPVPQFPTAAGQLDYAKSGLADKKRKGAAFRAVSALFPLNRHECGHAALGLAYLHLEPDYRFAKPIEIRKAANDFKVVLRNFSDIDDVQAKAHWYLGWLYCTLELDPDTGRRHFWTVVRDYPEVPMNLSAPVPWVNLAHPEAPPAINQPGQVKYWTQAALLELVRHPGTTSDTLHAFDLLYSRFFDSVETGLALKAMLSHPELAGIIRPKAFTWLSRNSTNPYLARDISALAGGRR